MNKVTNIIKEKKFTVSVELVPPRNGTSPDEVYSGIESLKGKVDFVSITRGAGGSLRGGSLPITHFAQKKFGIPAIAHFVCRERTKYEIENEIVDLHYFGIKNILALRGDPPAGSNEPWNGDYKYAYKLVSQINDLNKGVYLPFVGAKDGKAREGVATDFCIFVAGHPEDPISEELEHMKAKIDAGADAIITQMVFSFEEYKKYFDALRDAGIKLPIIAGVRPLVNYSQAESCEKFFGINVPDDLKEGLKGENAHEFGVSYAVSMIKKLKEYGADGVQLFVLNKVDLVHEILGKLS